MNATAKTPKPSRSEAMAQLLEETAELPDCCMESLVTFAKILKLNRGSITPVEQLLSGLVRTYATRDGTIRRDEVMQHVEQFEQDFDEMIEMAKMSFARYPELVTGPPISESAAA
ncbi:MAG TPA: hypothetical protein VGK29_13635 [Paludibaculum sp.]|jgi:hypothetical protein